MRKVLLISFFVFSIGYAETVVTENNRAVMLAPAVPVLFEGLGSLATIVTGVIAGSTLLSGDTPKQCTPPSGTMCYFYDQVPPSKPHYPHKGSHYYLFKMSEAPYCKWNKAGTSEKKIGTPCPFTRK